MSAYKAKKNRYSQMIYRRCGNSGLDLPAISFGLWHNFGGVDDMKEARQMLHYAFDHGITHFDLANNYGPPYGSAENNFGEFLKKDFKNYRDEMIISTKAGYDMWPGPYGNWGSRKYLIASLDQSLKRLNQDYVDIFYHHRPDPNTPLEETLGTLDHIVKQGKALYVGISNYDHEQAKEAVKLFEKWGTPFIINQVKYSMFNRWPEDHLLDTAEKHGFGIMAFSPLAEGLLTDKYLNGIPEHSRAAKAHGHLQDTEVTLEVIQKIKALNEMAIKRGQSLAQMALSWLLKDERVTTVLVGASKIEQLKANLRAIEYLSFTSEETDLINELLIKSAPA